MENDQEKENLEKQFNELQEKAEKEYSDINDAVNTMNFITAEMRDLQDYLNLTMQPPLETTNNKIQYT